MRGTVLFVATLALAACASDPAVVGDRSAPKFRDDLKSCRQSSGKEVSLQDAKTFPGWLASPFTSGGEMRRAVRACMVGKGYAAR
jgi:hypothetical protein